jgi:hypothetical protein
MLRDSASKHASCILRVAHTLQHTGVDADRAVSALSEVNVLLQSWHLQQGAWGISARRAMQEKKEKRRKEERTSLARLPS